MFTATMCRRTVRYVRALGVPARDADDVAQEALLGAWRSWRERGRSEEATWPLVRACATRQRSNYRRRAWTRLEALSDPPEAAAPVEPDATELRGVLAALARLPAEQRAAVALAAEGATPTEIGEAQGVCERTAVGRLRCARARLLRSPAVRALARRQV